MLKQDVIKNSDLREIAEELGIQDLFTRDETWVRGLCPFHNDQNNPNLDISAQYYKCWACGAHGGVAQFVKERKQLDYDGAVQWLANRLGVKITKTNKDNIILKTDKTEIKKYSRLAKKSFPDDDELALLCAFYNDCVEVTNADAKYLAGRGFDLNFINDKGVKSVSPNIKKWIVGRDTDELKKVHILSKKGKLTFYNGLVLPVFYQDKITSIQIRRFNMPAGYNPFMNIGSCIPVPYNWVTVTGSKKKPVYLTEGPLDALSIEQLKGGTVLGLFGTQHWTHKLAIILSKYPVILALDNDEAGYKATKKIASSLYAQGSKEVRTVYWPAGCKDANKYLSGKMTGAFVRKITRAEANEPDKKVKI